MRDEFEPRIHAAAVAGWWTLLIAAGIFLLQWLAYVIVVPAEPGNVLRLWGPGADWPHVRSTWFWFLAGYKVFLALFAFVLIWLTLWARELRGHKPATPESR